MRQRLKQLFFVGLGSIIAGIGINAFWVPHHLLSGGVSGIAMILYFLFNWPIGIMVAVLNIPLLITAYRLLDREYVLVALYGMAVFAVAIDATRHLATLNVVDDVLLASIYGGVVAGIGSGLVFRVNGSTGGTDIIAAILKKYYAFNVGLVGFSINCFIMAVAGLLFGAKPAMYTLISMFVAANLTDKVIEGLNRKKTLIIISEHGEAISHAIMHEVRRGVTVLKGEGAFTRQNKNVLFVVVTLTQVAKIKLIVEKTDPMAFMIVQDAAEVLGRGFSH